MQATDALPDQTLLQTLLTQLEASLQAPSNEVACAQAQAVLAQAAALTPSSDARLRSLACRALLAACSQFYRAGQHDSLRAALRTAEDLSTDLAPALRADVRLRAIENAIARHDVGEALQALPALLATTQQQGLRAQEARAWMCKGLALQAAGLHDQADELFARALQLMRDQAQPRQLADLWLCRAQIKHHDRADALAAARHACEQALLHGLASGPQLADTMAATALCNRAALELLNGEAAAAAPCLARAEALLNLSLWQRWLIRLLHAMVALCEQPDGARRQALDRLLDGEDAPSRAYLVASYPVAAALYAQRGDNARAVALLNRLADARAQGFAALAASAQGVDLILDAGVASGAGSLLERMAVIAELRDDATGRHCFRVGKLAALLAERVGLGAEGLRAIHLAARLHDVGKVAIPDEILLKPGRFDADERRLMERHTVFGHELLGESADPVRQMARLIARHHHERWDGLGYPDGLAGEAIPLAARIAALADVFDALTHARPYKTAWSREQALQFIAEAAGTHFDPHLTACFLDLMAEAQRDWAGFYAALEADASGLVVA